MLNEQHFLLTGGGTLGSVTPLLAIAAELRKRNANVSLSFIGTPNGPERLLVESQRIPFWQLAAPKLDRYRWWLWPILPVMFVFSWLRALRLLYVMKPNFVFAAGGYVGVPVAWAAFFLRIPVWVHQLDVLPGLANKLMAPVARKISVTFEETAKHFPKRKTIVVGSMVRQAIRHGEREVALQRYGFNVALPTLLVVGGGTGAAAINEACAVIWQDLVPYMNVLHLVGRGKMLTVLEQAKPGYVALEFLNEGMADAYAVADLVVARAGLGTISELAALGKPSIIIPIHEPFQEANAKVLEERKAAQVIWHLTPQILEQTILRLLDSPELNVDLSKNIRGLFALNADERIAHEVLTLLAPKL
ncbi:TPA: UDP-N-acetylglucosamine--N-acetylmuramyl-(pentapeptide) pyrophosphoryl-undecaprenol N-acetylglucosamine transferase [Candidatus Uhrbacteria bacterium]|nr:UDP-N-acetylglucosamine--N-acetylmuramyl-(pentapeptide) pyrophosphoryl-undecaprenol N-acetylglucosamine transferase [Candidatus Uhrbacteria bacterium]